MHDTPDNVSVLIVEDHRDIAEMVCDYLEQQGYLVDYAADGPSGLNLAADNDYDVIVLDLMLPGLDGLEVCRRLRNEKRRDTPLLMLTARDTLEDKIDGLDAGADDYLVKPFELRELDARLRAMLRRQRGQVAGAIYTIGDLKFDTTTLEVSRAGQTLTLTPVGLRLLTVLMRESPRVVTRREIEHEVWGDEPPDSDALRSHLYNLRKVIDKPFDVPLLRTLPGTGYRLVTGSDD